MTKERTIARVYYDEAAGFGSLAETLRRAKEEDPTISRQDVQASLA